MSTFRRSGWFSYALVTSLFLLWISVSAVAAVSASWSVRSWQNDDGLPDNSVTGIAQNSVGYLWVATQGGLALFDGVRFQEVELNTPSQRTRPLIRSMLLINGDTLWLALEGGMVISRSSTHTNVFSPTDGLPSFRPTSLAQARDGSVWVGYVDGSACRIVGLRTLVCVEEIETTMPPSSASQSVSPFIWSMERMSGRVRCDGVFSSTS